MHHSHTAGSGTSREVMLQDDTDSIHARVLREKLRGPDGEQSTYHLVSSRRGWGNQDLRNLEKDV